MGDSLAVKYHPSYAARVRDLAFVGLNDTEMSRILGISVSTLKYWKDNHPEFSYAWEDGKSQAAIKVAGSLMKRALGYDYWLVKETPAGTLREQKHVPADVGAATNFLHNWRPDVWKNKIEQDGGTNVNIFADSLTDVEAARRIAFALAKAMNIQTEEREVIEHGQRSESETE